MKEQCIEFAEWTREQESLGYIAEEKLWGYVNELFLKEKQNKNK